MKSIQLLTKIEEILIDPAFSLLTEKEVRKVAELIGNLVEAEVMSERERNIKIADHFGCSRVVKWIKGKDSPI